jgi:hypothetical protein
LAQRRGRAYRGSHYEIEVETAANSRCRFECKIGGFWRS